MKPLDADVLIVGGGLVGAALALALRHSRLSVRLLDGREPVFDWPAESWGSRVYAINESSRNLLERIGVWSRLDAERMQPVPAMEIFGDAGRMLRFGASEAGLYELTTILESRELHRALWQAVREAPNIAVEAPAAAESLQIDTDAARMRLADGRELAARLVVGADGAQSWVRGQLGIEPAMHDYRQFGVVANFVAENPHHGTAFQWFRTDGVLAWLPLPGNRFSMAWLCPQELKERLLGLDAAALAATVAEAGASRLGRLELVTPPEAYPLRLTHVPKLAASRVALVGDAAHTIHPLAGQGVNLGFGDVAELSGILSSGLPEYCGDLARLRRYELARRGPVLLMQGVCHGLQQLFNNTNPLLGAMRNLGMGWLDQVECVKRQMVRQVSRH